MKKLLALFLLTAFHANAQRAYKITGTIERLDPAFDKLISRDAKAEIIAEGFEILDVMNATVSFSL